MCITLKRDALGRWRLAKAGALHLTRYSTREQAEAAKYKIEQGLIRWVSNVEIERFKNVLI
jgi:hypothetical protein